MVSLEERAGLTGRVVWVVGAGGGGIGTAVCEALAASGAEIVAIDRNEAALEPTLDAARAAGGRIHPMVIDACRRSDMEAFAQGELAADRRPSGLVNIVGGLPRELFGAILDTDEDALDKVLNLNLRASWIASQVFARLVLEQGKPASIVQLASIAALQGMPFGAPYAAAKAALISIARTQALEWGPHGIRVNAIAAGSVRTPRAGDSDPERDRRTLPLGRRGTGQDIAGAVLFLLSDLASWVTGQVLAVDGGASIKPSYLGDDGLPVFIQDEALRARLTGKPT